MKKITLVCGEDKIDTTCAGVSTHIYDKYVVHKLSKAGVSWYNALPENHPAVWAYTARGAKRLDYISADPLP
jgi:hypothetical protein